MDMMELWGGFPSREMLKSKSGKGAVTVTSVPQFSQGKPSGSLESEATSGREVEEGKGALPQCLLHQRGEL